MLLESELNDLFFKLLRLDNMNVLKFLVKAGARPIIADFTNNYSFLLEHFYTEQNPIFCNCFWIIGVK